MKLNAVLLLVKLNYDNPTKRETKLAVVYRETVYVGSSIDDLWFLMRNYIN